MFRQRTIKSPVHAIGIGVHSGAKVRMGLRPAKAGSGIQFVRTDLDGANSVRACAESVSDTALSTTISQGPINVATVEHLMSALWGLGVDNLFIEPSAEEVPIMDGSAAPFIDMINSVGIVDQDEAKQFIRINREICVNQGEATASLKPYAGFKAGYTFVADHKVFNRYPKYAELDFGTTSYEASVSGARSFGLLKELPHAQAVNTCRGSSLENAVGIDDDSVVNEGGLRYHDEFVKHKLLDVIGDLYLLGRPIMGAFEGYMSGHALNNKLARALLRCDDAWDVVSYELDDQSKPQEIMVKRAAAAE